MVGWVILFSILGLLLLVLLIPVRFCFSYDDEPKLTIWIAFVPLHILPSAEQDEEKEQEEAPSKKIKKQEENEEKREKKNFFSELRKEKGLKGFVGFLKKLLLIVCKAVKRIGKHLIAERCEAEVTVGGEDSAAVAEQYGKICAAAFPVWGQMISLTRCRKHNLQIHPDFLADGYQISCNIRIKLRVFWAVRAVVAALGSFLKLLIQEKVSIAKAEAQKAAEKDTVRSAK